MIVEFTNLKTGHIETYGYATDSSTAYNILIGDVFFAFPEKGMEGYFEWREDK